MKSKKTNIVISIICSILSVLLTFIGFKIYHFELRQIDSLNDLKSRVLVLESKFSTSDLRWSSNSFNYLAIGNSITKHGVCDYWWTESGMAASKPEKDYFHLVSDYLQNTFHAVTSFAYDFSVWETMSYDREETLVLLYPYLDDDLDLITIQLGENIQDDTTFESDLSELISSVRSKCLEAKIILIGDFWISDNHNSVKEKVADSYGIQYVDLSNIANNAEYQAGLNYKVTDDNGKIHSVQHNGVAKHPNDKAMQYIADGIISCF